MGTVYLDAHGLPFQLGVIDRASSNKKCYQFMPLDDMVIQQFTNLLDKNGKEIWEGDIVEWVENFGGSDRIHRIQVEIPRIYRTIWDDPGLIFEVIGNIYENPELLK